VHHRHHRLHAAATPGGGGGGGAADGASSSSSGGGGGASGSGNGPRGGRRLRGGKAQAPGLFEIKDVSPPPRSLGVYALPPNTHTQDVIELCVDAAEDWQATLSTGSSSGGGSGESGSDADGANDKEEGQQAAVRRYVVTALVLQFKLVAGRYRRDHSRLEVQPMGRFLTNLSLESAFSAKPYLKGGAGGEAGGGGGGGGGKKGGGSGGKKGGGGGSA
jgi:hypothetical protein